MPDQRDGQQLGIGAGWHRPRRGCDGYGPRADCVIDQHVHVDEQILGGLAGDSALRRSAQQQIGYVRWLLSICTHMLAI